MWAMLTMLAKLFSIFFRRLGEYEKNRVQAKVPALGFVVRFPVRFRKQSAMAV